MAAMPKIKFMGVRGGAIHVITTKTWDMKNSKCPSVKKGHTGPGWRGKSISPEAALDLKGCSRCDTHAWAKKERRARQSPEDRRAESRDARQQSLNKASKSATKTKARRGPRLSGDMGERMKALCDEHANYAKQHGWKVQVIEVGPTEWHCSAKRAGETLLIKYQDGRNVWSRVTLANGNEVRLRNSKNWKLHAEGKSGIKPDQRPKRKMGKKAVRNEEHDDSADRDMPFSIDQDHDTIIESLVGRRIKWRNSTSRVIDVAVVPQRSRNCRITAHPKSGRLMISFYESQGIGEHGELLGGERTVYLDKILEVG